MMIRGRGKNGRHAVLPRLLFMLLCGGLPVVAHAAADDWRQQATEYRFAARHAAGNVHYFVTNADKSYPVTSVLIVMHGHPRDVGRTLSAARQAASGNASASHIPIVAPLFQVAASQNERCKSPGLPAPSAGDVLWNCHSWLEGGLDEQGKLSAFAAIDQLLAQLKQRWPGLHQVTFAGFSAGGQFVQHYIAFARPPAGIRMRYVVADPGSWLWFDPRPTNGCQQVNQWKYGMEKVPAWLVGSAEGARDRYRAAAVSYLVGGEDQGSGPGRYEHILDKSCAAESQGQYRLDRAVNYAHYDAAILKPVTPHPFDVVPGCRHDVRCVFPSDAGRERLFSR
ncbi:hypothetical protein [Erwinia mallotivora]|uniref:hypothetical protein n=1 Tax=Erwinia mallotivora TaxID=69222 RepID=UPI0021BED8CF|nr:hypothetical protein [Erwinia mallotivora]